ncbi:hypothetical protein Bca52824_046701 [Brassica carinata]|uniref:Uncharacterized protein n=1 Tax=Brassica carinata TaxID=52824 RepID=A0A8X7RFW6_BRACI|nr:hypothetical protein Bca52824_046701 [Brassica carinata]
MEEDDLSSPPLCIPDRIFAVGHEPVGVRGLIGGQVIQPVIHTGNQTRRDSHEEMITDDPPDAILFSNQANTFAVDVLNGAQEIQSSIHTEYQTLRGGAHKSGAEDMVASNPSASLVVDNPPPQYPLGREGKVADHRQSSPYMNLDPELLFTKPTFSLGLTQEERPHWKETVTEGVSMCENDVDHSQSPPDTNLDHELPFPKPTFSLGLTQEECPHPKEAVTEGETMCENAAGKEICEKEDQLDACRKSKRLKALPKSLVGQYECDMRLLNRARVAFVDPDNTGGNIDYVAKLSYLLDKLNDDSVNDSMVRPVSDFAASPIDFPPESYSLSKEAQLEWFNENAFFERKESQKGNSFPAQSTNTNSSSQMISLKSKTSVIRLPKPQKTCFNEVKKRRNCRIARTLMIPKRFGSLLKSDPSLSEPGSPKVSCIGRRQKSVRTDSLKDKPVMVKKPGFFASVRAIFRTGGGCKSLTASGVHAPYKEAIAPSRRSSDIRGRLPPEEDEKSSPPRMSTGSRKYIDGEEPVLPGLGGMTRFTSGRIPDLLVED